MDGWRLFKFCLLVAKLWSLGTPAWRDFFERPMRSLFWRQGFMAAQQIHENPYTLLDTAKGSSTFQVVTFPFSCLSTYFFSLQIKLLDICSQFYTMEQKGPSVLCGRHLKLGSYQGTISDQLSSFSSFPQPLQLLPIQTRHMQDGCVVLSPRHRWLLIKHLCFPSSLT